MEINTKDIFDANIKTHNLVFRLHNFYSLVRLQYHYLIFQKIIYICGFVSIVNRVCNGIISIYQYYPINTNVNNNFISDASNQLYNQTLTNSANTSSYFLQVNFATLFSAFIFKSFPAFIANFNNIKTFFSNLSMIASIFVVYFLSAATRFYEIMCTSINCVIDHTNLLDEARSGSTGAMYLLSWTNPNKIFDILIECCIDQSDSKLVVKLLKYVKDINRLVEGGNTALHVVLINNRSTIINQSNEIVKLLLKNGLDPNIQNNKGETVLHLSIPINKQVLINDLLNNEVIAIKTNLQDKEGRAPLHLAVRMGNYQFIIKLFNKDADHNITDNNGKKPIEYIFLKDHQDKYEQMLKAEEQKNIAKLFQKWNKIDYDGLGCHKTKEFLRKLIHNPSLLLSISRESSESSVGNNMYWSARVSSINMVAHNNDPQTTFIDESTTSTTSSIFDSQFNNLVSPKGDEQLSNQTMSITYQRKSIQMIDRNLANLPAHLSKSYVSRCASYP